MRTSGADYHRAIGKQDPSAQPLSRREREVAALVAQSLTNKEIADRLGISERTIEGHVLQILNKLGYRSRTQIATWFVQQPPGVAALPTVGPAVRRRAPLALAAFVVLALVAAGAFAATELRAPGGTIRTIAGTGVAGFSVDGATARATALARPVALATHGGLLYVVDGDRVRRVEADGTIRTVAGTGEAGYTGDHGPATAARLNGPQAIAFDSDGNLYIADTKNDRVRRVDASGAIETVLGPDVVAGPRGLVAGYRGDLYVADTGNNRVLKLRAGVVTVVAGTGEARYAGDGGVATSATLNSPQGLAFDPRGNLYIADVLNDRIRRVDLAGVMTTVAGSGRHGASGDGARAVFADLELDGRLGGSAGGSLAVDGAGALFVADALNHRVRRVGLDGLITTVAGSGTAGSSGDEGPSESAALDLPLAVGVDENGVLYVADDGAKRIRAISGLAN